MAFGDLIAAADRNAQALLGGEPVAYHPQAGPAVTVTGIFDEPFMLVQGGAEDGVETKVPTVFLRLADLPTDPEVDHPTLTIRGVTYRVWKRQPAGFGSIQLWLRKVV